MNWQAVFKRFKEPSSFAGMAGLFGIFGFQMEDPIVQSGILVVAGIFGFLAIAFGEKGEKK